ncbi:MAG TPA: aminotransferase class V-fold PLP-dependent enzyme [Geodermatophilus sp.]|nr:aminotransferase class V-fold PLP-dependent enzyme [Geodermatophilus sp.]
MATPSSERATLTWEEVRTLYPGAADVAYLDSAAVGLISSRVRDAMTAVLTEHQQHGIAAAPSWRGHARSVRVSVARLVGGRADQVAFTQNTSTGLATVTNGLDWRDGDNVVVPAGEFPSNFYPWLHLRRRGVQVREVAMVDGQARVDDVLAALDHRTRVLAVSAVQYSSGHRYDLGEFGAACQNSDVLLVVDGTQAVGAVTVDAELLGIDVLAVSAHKWMLGPFGIGFTHLSQRAMQRLTPSTVGWLSVEDPFTFDHEPRLAEDGRRFESGTENSAGIAGLGATVDLVHGLDRQRVEDRVLDRAAELATLLEEVGMDVHLPARRDRRSGIVIASRPGTPPQVLHDRLLSQGVRCSLRGNGLRFAPHYFTSDSDLHRAADTLRHPA